MKCFLLLLWLLGTPLAAQQWPSPFVRDTLFPVVGGAFLIRREYSPPPMNRGVLYPAYTQFAPDTVVTIHNYRISLAKQEHLAAHEGGHILDARHLAWEVYAIVTERCVVYPHPHDYFGSDPTEYVAEAFAHALESGRHRFADSLALDQQFPGTLNIIRWLQTVPPFKHSM